MYTSGWKSDIHNFQRTVDSKECVYEVSDRYKNFIVLEAIHVTFFQQYHLNLSKSSNAAKGTCDKLSNQVSKHLRQTHILTITRISLTSSMLIND